MAKITYAELLKRHEEKRKAGKLSKEPVYSSPEAKKGSETINAFLNRKASMEQLLKLLD